MKKGLLLLALVAFVGTLTAQEATFYYFVDGDVTLDGVLDDDMWSTNGVTELTEFVNFQAEEPTLTDVSVKAFWNDDALFVAVTATDDVWAPSWITGGDNYNADKLEIYFDCNEVLDDGEGAGDVGETWAPHNEGHHQWAPNWPEGDDVGAELENDGTMWAATYDGVDGGSYAAEYKFPWTVLTDLDANAPYPYDRTIMGFDVTLIDNDDGAAGPTNRKRLNWANAGAIDESWNNMDDAGVVTLSTDTPASVANLSVANLSVYPTIANEFINLPDAVNTVEIFNTLGQRVKMVNNPGAQLDISALQTGVHFVKVTKDSQESITKIIVE